MADQNLMHVILPSSCLCPKQLAELASTHTLPSQAPTCFLPNQTPSHAHSDAGGPGREHLLAALHHTIKHHDAGAAAQRVGGAITNTEPGGAGPELEQIHIYEAGSRALHTRRAKTR